MSTIWEEVKKVIEEAEARKVVREFVAKQLTEVGGMGSGNSDSEGDSPETESEVEANY